MRDRGIKVSTGKWLIEGLPQVVLFDIPSLSGYLNDWRAEFYNKTHISGPYEDSEFNDCILYGFACAWFVGEWIHQYKLVHETEPLTVCHFHEWLSGVGLILSRLRKVKFFSKILNKLVSNFSLCFSENNEDHNFEKSYDYIYNSL